MKMEYNETEKTKNRYITYQLVIYNEMKHN